MLSACCCCAACWIWLPLELQPAVQPAPCLQLCNMLSFAERHDFFPGEAMHRPLALRQALSLLCLACLGMIAEQK